MKNTLIVALLSLSPAFLTGCVLTHEPEGGGTDPYVVNAEVAVSFKIALPDSEGAYDDFIPDVSADDFVRRFTLHIVQPDGTVVDSYSTCVNHVSGKNEYEFNTKFRLHPRQYKVIAWCDFVRGDDMESHLHYNTESLQPVMPNGNYVGNNERKDCFRGCADLDLRSYRNEWASNVYLEMELSRPVGRYEIITTDLGAFRNRLNEGLISGNSFTARIRYADYRATGYNVLQDIPKNFLSYTFYNTSLNNDNWSGDQASMRLGFDYCLVDAGEKGSKIPLEIEILNDKGTQVSRTVMTIPVVQGYNTVISGRFMTGTDDGSVAVDPGYDGEIHIDLGKL